VVTTAGEIEIELWGRECPKTVRNFIALSMEGEFISVLLPFYLSRDRASLKEGRTCKNQWLMIGYYDGVIFHRLVPDFIVQTGDPTGTGLGGESFYGEPFADEKHGRLRFNRYVREGRAQRGLSVLNGGMVKSREIDSGL
jgi:peptidyl-prolyl cis-trans isomerase SDCCAG10